LTAPRASEIIAKEAAKHSQIDLKASDCLEAWIVADSSPSFSQGFSHTWVANDQNSKRAFRHQTTIVIIMVFVIDASFVLKKILQKDFRMANKDFPRFVKRLRLVSKRNVLYLEALIIKTDSYFEEFIIARIFVIVTITWITIVAASSLFFVATI
jgi:hypothetical protein